MIDQVEEAEKSGEKLFEDMQLLTADNEFERDIEEDSDESVKAPLKKKTKQGVLHYSEDDDDDDDDDSEDKSKITERNCKSEAGTIIVKLKKQKKEKQTNAALSETRNGSS